ncbi:MAG: hypothetical protein PHN88_16115 [Ignavibacteria bacterium]|nr:hypothetical protein [Ignavibacteria bacterium]
MKLKIWFTVVLFYCAFISLNAQVTFTENFDYPAGDTIGAHGWTGFSGNTNNIKIKSPGLAFTNYILSNIGNCARLSNNGLDNYKNADSIYSGNLYVSFMVKVDSARAIGDYFLAMLPTSSTTNYYLRVFVKDTLGGICFGVSKSSINSSTLPAWGSTVFPYGTTCLVIAKYKFNTGSTTDDEVSLYAFSSNLPATEPGTPYAGPITTTQTDATLLNRVAVRQGSVSIAPSLDIDGIQVSRTWGDFVQISIIPSLVSPLNNSTGNSLNLNLVWTKPQSTIGYNVLLATDTGFTNIIINDSTLTDSVKAVTNLNPLTTYYWKVRAKNASNWGSFSSVWNFTTQAPVTGVPNLISPANASSGNPVNLNLIWTKPAYALTYNVVLATDAGFASIVLNDSTLTDSLKTLTNLNPLTTYYWKVRAKGLSGWGSFSSAFNFTTLGAASPVVLNFPANNAAGLSVNLTFNWFRAFDQTLIKNKDKNINAKYGPLAVSNYWFELATDAGFSNIVTRDSSLTDTTKSVSGLNNITDYYWRVKAKNQIGWGTFSAGWKFTTIVPVPGVPTLISPAFGSTGNPLNLNLVWTKPANSTNYNVQLATDTGFTNIILNDSTLTDSIKVITNLTPLTNYYWKVRAKSISGWSSFSSAFSFKTIGTASQVVLNSPSNNSTGLPVNLAFKWFKAFDLTDNSMTVSNYWFELSSDSLFNTITLRDTTLTDTTKSITGLSTQTKYWWRVKAKNQIGWGGFSSVWNLTTVFSVPSVPLLLSPANNSIDVTLTPALAWNNASGAASYRIQVSTDSLFTAILWDTTGVSGASNSIPAGKLTGLTKYYWRVNATNAGGTSAWSTVFNFRTVQNLSLNLKVYLEGFWDGTSQVRDTVTVYLAGATTPHAFVDSAKVFLSTTGTSAVTFSKAPNASYYIVIQHRNHLQTWSALTQAFVTNAAVNYDFTTAAAQAFGSNMKQAGSVWVLYGGDANMDGSVDGLDIVAFVPQFGTQGYLSCDFNGDGDVNASDVFIITANYGLTIAVPTVNTNFNPPAKQKIDINDAIKNVNTNTNKENVKQSPTVNKKTTGSGNVKKQNKK